MTNFRKKVAPALVLLAGASMSLAGVTYAWFTSNKEASVSNINVHVTDQAGGIAISSSANGDYGNSIDFDFATAETKDVEGGGKEIVEVGESDNKHSKAKTTLLPISTIDNLVGDAGAKVFDFYTGSINPAKTSELISSDKATSGYLSVDMYFENTNAASQDIFFNYGLGDNPTSNDVLKKVFSYHSKSSEALRIGFIYQGTTVNKTDTSYAGSTATSIIIEPDEREHLESLKMEAVKQDYFGLKAKFKAGENDVVAQPIKPTAGTAYMDAVTTYTIKDCDGVAGHKLFTIPQGYSKVSIVVWLEGQDCDCLNAIAATDLQMGFSFIAKDAA